MLIMDSSSRLVDVRARAGERRVPSAVTLDRQDVVVARDRPELLDRVPEHRRFVAEPAVRVPGIDVELRIEDVDDGRRVELAGHACVTSRSDSAVRPELGPLAGDDALHDPVSHGVTLSDPDRRVAELAEQAEVLVVPAVGDVLAVEMQRHP